MPASHFIMLQEEAYNLWFASQFHRSCLYSSEELQVVFHQNFIKSTTVKTLYNVTRYNRTFNIRHKIAGNRSVSIKIPTL